MKKKIFCFDLDNTICITKGKQYSRSQPIKEAIILINKLYSEGHYIKIFTSRYMGRNDENINKAYKQGYKFTHKQLKSWGLKFHKLLMGIQGSGCLQVSTGRGLKPRPQMSA